MELLAQVADLATEGRLFGLSVVEWGVLLGFIGSFVGAVVKHLQASKGARKVEAMVSAFEEAQDLHPEAMRLAKRLVRDKATKLGVETGWLGLNDDVKRHTMRLKRKPLGEALGPDDPTPDPDEAKP